MTDDNDSLQVLLAKIFVADEESRRARARVYELKHRASKAWGELKRNCRHGRILHVRSLPYVTEANDFHGGNWIIACRAPRRICLDCGAVERVRLSERFTDDCPREFRVRAPKLGEKGREEKLQRQSVSADRSARFIELTARPKARITSEELEAIIGRRSYDLIGGCLEVEELYALWLKYGKPRALTPSQPEEPAS